MDIADNDRLLGASGRLQSNCHARAAGSRLETTSIFAACDGSTTLKF